MTDIGLGHAMWPKSHFDAICANLAPRLPLDDGTFLVFFRPTPCAIAGAWSLTCLQTPILSRSASVASATMTNPFNRADKHGAPDMRVYCATVGRNADAHHPPTCNL